MSATTAVPHAEPRRRLGLLGWLTTTNHKQIGWLYIGVDLRVLPGRRHAGPADPHPAGAAGHARSCPSRPYNQIFTIHGTTMVFLVIAPIGLGFANYFVPLQIGAPDMAFPRMNALSVWLFIGGGLTIYLVVPDVARRRGGRVDGLRAAVETAQYSPGPAPTCGSWASCWSARRRS